MTNAIRLVAGVATIGAAGFLARKDLPLIEAAPADSSFAEQVLANARGTNPFMCELALQSVDNRFGTYRRVEIVPDARAAESEVVGRLTSTDLEADAVPILVAALSDTDRCARRVAARLVGRIDEQSTVDALLRRLRDPNATARQMAAIALGYSEDTGATTGLVTALADEVPSVRAAAAWALGSIEDPGTIRSLIEVLRKDRDAGVRRQAAWALGNMS